MIQRDEYLARADEAAAFLRDAGLAPVDAVLQCGSGLTLAGPLGAKLSVPMDQVPHFPASRVQGHGREIALAELGGRRVLVLTGRAHLYEGHTPDTVAFPAAVAKACGAKLFLGTNAAGGLNQHMRAAEVMLHRDYINFQGDNALAHLHTPEPAERFVDPKPAYDTAATSALGLALAQAGLTVHEGVYVAVRGPVFETRAEVYMLRSLGADAVGMSTVPEVMMCRFLGLPVVAVSVVSNECFAEAVTHGQVIAGCATALTALAAGLRAYLEKV